MTSVKTSPSIVAGAAPRAASAPTLPNLMTAVARQGVELQLFVKGPDGRGVSATPGQFLAAMERGEQVAINRLSSATVRGEPPKGVVRKVGWAVRGGGYETVTQRHIFYNQRDIPAGGDAPALKAVNQRLFAQLLNGTLSSPQSLGPPPKELPANFDALLPALLRKLPGDTMTTGPLRYTMEGADGVARMALTPAELVQAAARGDRIVVESATGSGQVVALQCAPGQLADNLARLAANVDRLAPAPSQSRGWRP